MKKIVSFVLCIAMAVSMVACSSGAKEQTVTGEAQGNNDVIKVEVVFSDSEIKSVTVKEHKETLGICDSAIEQIPAAIVEAQSTAVDTVSGATFTSNGIINAVKDAANKAGVTIADTKSVNDALLTPGKYTATAHGLVGDTTVEVEVNEDSILSVNVIECTDVPKNVSKAAISTIPQAIVEAQSTEVDVAAGATFTSNAIKGAVKAALKEAGNADRFATELPKTELTQSDDEYVDVLVLGAGGSGSMAALYAKNWNLTGEDTGLSVMAVEKQSYIGGSTMMSGGFIGAAAPLGDETNLNNKEMMQAYIDGENADEESPINEKLLEDVARVSNHGVLDMQSLGYEVMTEDSMRPASEYDWLISWSILTHWQDEEREGWEQAGDEIADFLETRLDRTGVDVRLNTTADELIVEDGAVVGAVVHDKEHTYNVYAKKVVDACGSFAGDKQYFDEVYPDYTGMLIYANGGNTGDGIKMVEDKFDVKFVKGRLMIAYFSVEAPHGIDNDLRYFFFDGVNPIFLVNKEGNRFVYDGAGYSTYGVHEAFALQSDGRGYVIVSANDERSAMLPECDVKNAIVHGTLDEISAELGLNAENLKASVAKYEDVRAGEETDEFGVAADSMCDMSGEEFYAFPMYSAMTATYSGFDTNEVCEIILSDGTTIPNLYAVGETAHGMAGLNNALFSGAIAGNDIAEKLAK